VFECKVERNANQARDGYILDKRWRGGNGQVEMRNDGVLEAKKGKKKKKVKKVKKSSQKMQKMNL